MDEEMMFEMSAGSLEGLPSVGEMFDLTGKVAVVSGTIGLALSVIYRLASCGAKVVFGARREVIGQMDLKELMRDRESFNAKVFGGSKDDLANLGLELRTFNVQDFSDSQGIIRSMGADQAAEIKKEAELAQSSGSSQALSDQVTQLQIDLQAAQEELSGVICVGAPIFNYTGYPCGAIWISGPKDRLSKEVVKNTVKVIKEIAGVISNELGFRK